MIRKEGMVERLGEMRKGRRERSEKGSREGIEKETKRQLEEKECLRDPPLLEFLDPTLRCSHCFFCFFKSSGYDIGAQASKFVFYKLIESIIKKICHGMKQNAKKKAENKQLIRRERRDGKRED